MRTRDHILLENAYDQVGENKYKQQASQLLQSNRAIASYLPLLAELGHEAFQKGPEEGDQWIVSFVADLMQNSDNLNKFILSLQQIKNHLTGDSV